MNIVKRGKSVPFGVGLLMMSTVWGCGTVGDKPGAIDNNRNSSAESELIQSLRKQVRDRDRRIAELTSQLDALKRIDQDMDTGRKPRQSPIH